MDFYRLLPWFWFQNDPTDWQWDAILNEALDKFGADFSDPSDRVAIVGPLVVWAANWPYAYGSAYGGYNKTTGLPSAGTRLRLRRMLSGRSGERSRAIYKQMRAEIADADRTVSQ